MNKINVMSENLANKIAAGEVVERIANVIKELVENSIDAGSKNIKIELTGAGSKLIKIVDDGCGMSREDAKLCFQRHATSKIKNENDLYFISSLGFRGEALAAISSVSKVILDTYDGTESTYLVLKNGKFIEEKTGSMRVGTIIEVSELFYNTPASNDLYKTIHEIYGYTTSKNMIQIKGENYDYEVNGYISNLNISKSNRNNMITLVNGRVVSNKDINRTIKDAYHTVLAENKFPIVVINIITDPTLVDVNIHPTKQDIKFSKLDSLNELLFDLIKSALNETDNTFKAYEQTTISNNEVDVSERKYENIRMAFNTDEETVKYENVKKEDNMLIKPVGLALGTYLIAQDEDVMYMIDIHAANERINYERYMDALAKRDVYTTSMLFPIQLEYSKNEYMNILHNIDEIRNLGFKVEEFGTNTFRVIEHPSWLKEGYEEESIRRIFELIGEFKDTFDRVKFNEKAAIRLACKMSVKANTSITHLEQEELLNRLFKCKFPYTCPHGRPTIIKYPIYELEKLFKRVN